DVAPTNLAATAAPPERKPRDDEIDVFGLTHRGNVRKSNNDHFLVAILHKKMDVLLTSLPGLADSSGREERVAIIGMVADGVGGSEAGEEASRIALETVSEYLSTSLQAYYGASDAEGALQKALQDAAMRTHERVREVAERRNDQRKRATTLTLIVGVWPWLYLLQVGDSRYYRFRDGVLTQVTRDQTFAQDLIDAGALSTDQAKDSPLKNVLSSAIGGDQTAPVVTRFPSDWKNVHLACSDGLTKHVSDERIRERLAGMTSARQACEALLQDALDGGGSDNITVLIARTVRRD
ncbi:MAG TPA: PP2C family serine/threonine-protein phosphatase, partial [Gemmatimonadaceae bacterium]|nr:PP2C family serine/threonine-protein phosphatase [Gemmatimonadaceae bacterium]